MIILRIQDTEKTRYVNLEKVCQVSVEGMSLVVDIGEASLRFPIGKHGQEAINAFGVALRPLYESRMGTVLATIVDFDLRPIQKKAQEEEAF